MKILFPGNSLLKMQNIEKCLAIVYIGRVSYCKILYPVPEANSQVNKVLQNG